MEYIAGIDLGTSSVKILIADRTGKQIALAQKEYEIMIPNVGWAEQSPQLWWDCTVDVIQQAIQASGIRPSQIKSIGFSGQMHGLVALDERQEPVRPAIIWMDGRTQPQLDMIQKTAGFDFVAKETLNHPSTGFLLSSLLWVKQNEPQKYEKIKWVMLPKDYIRMRLTGTIGTDFTDASGTLAYSVQNYEWSSALLHALELDSSLFPPVFAPYDVAGKVTTDAAQETGFASGTIVAFGGADQPMQSIGNGIVQEGIMACNIGTASQLSTPMCKPLYDHKQRTQTFCHAEKGLWFIQGASLNGGSALSWMRNKLLESSKSFAALDAEAALIPPGSDGLLFLSYLNGERTPYMDPFARGVLFGMTTKHTQGHLMRATMEGVVYSLYDSLEIFTELGMKPESLIASGGGAKSDIWRQIQADILQLPVYTTQTKEEACLGAAIMGGIAVGFYRDIHDACTQIVHLDPIPTIPNAANKYIYQHFHGIYRELYLRNKDLFLALKSPL